MKKPLVILIGGAVLILVLVLILLNKKDTANTEELRGVAGDPTDITMDFLGDWLEARISSTTDPYTKGLATSTVLGLEPTAPTQYCANPPSRGNCVQSLFSKLKIKLRL